MTDALAHRGPEGEAIWQNAEGTALLGHRRLKVIDLSEAAAQPLQYIGRYTITFNGEIYNFIELRKELQNEGYQFHTSSDTEVILAAYAHWDEECVEHFDGMFAFAIWDQVERELFAARDRFGEKPFFYYHAGDTFLFASEMKALWAAGIPRSSNLRMLFNFLTIGYTDNPARPEETFYDNVLKLPPASWLYYKPSTRELDIERYWDIDPDEQQVNMKESEVLEKFDHLLNASVKRRMRSDVTLGTSLSGGLDSSMIAALMHELQDGRQDQQRGQKAFTAIFPGFAKDESDWSASVANRFGLEQHRVAVTSADLVKDWSGFMQHQEEPVSSASAFAQYKVFELAKDQGVKVLLDGQGADETMAGYHKYYKWYWQELFQGRRLMKSGEIRAARALGVTESFGIKNIVASLFPDLASVVLERQYLLHALRQQDLHPDFVKLQSKEAYYTTPEVFNLNGYLYFNTVKHGLEELLRYADRNSMSFGREVRLPFLNHELVEFLFMLPANYKIRQGWTKWILRQSAGTRLPDEITWRKDKTGFEPPQQEWMKDPRVQEMMMAGREKLVLEKILDPSVLRREIDPSHAYDPDNQDWRYFAAAAYLG